MIEARLLSSNEALAYAVIILPALVVFAVVFFLVRRSLARRGTHWRAFAFPVLAALALAIGVPKAAAYAFPDPMQRFERELGGSGRCLGNSLYASRDAFPRQAVVTRSPGTDRMTIAPLHHAAPALTLAHARKGSLQHLIPADADSKQILDSHGC